MASLSSVDGTTRRVEWRGDLFASDLPLFLDRLAQGRHIAYELPHTLTVFLQPERRTLDVKKTLRFRCYCALPDFSPDAVLQVLERQTFGKLQIKASSGTVTELNRGAATLERGATLPAPDGFWKVRMGGELYRASSVRVARRSHFEFDGPHETVRLTVDHQRLLFRLHQDTVRFLGAMGPRVEIKSPTRAGARRVQAAVNGDGVLRRLPYHSLELLFQDALRQQIDPAVMRGYPEMECKFDLEGHPSAGLPRRVERLVLDDHKGAFLLPYPHRIVRMRRYHFCATDESGEQRTLVETTAGRLSPKLKSGRSAVHGVLVRTTQASRTTDIDGSRQTAAAFLAERGWTVLNRMDKIQTKLPFRLPNGNCYQWSLDACVDRQGQRLRQAELEYIGSLEGRPAAQQLCDEMANLAKAAPFSPSDVSKYDYFTGRAARIASRIA